MGDDVRPYAASVRNPGPDADRARSFSLEDAEGPDEFRVSDGDEEARQARLSAPPTPKPTVTGEDRDRLVRECADAVVAWSGIYGGADLAIRALADRLNIDAAEAEALVLAERARRK